MTKKVDQFFYEVTLVYLAIELVLLEEDKDLSQVFKMFLLYLVVYQNNIKVDHNTLIK